MFGAKTGQERTQNKPEVVTVPYRACADRKWTQKKVEFLMFSPGNPSEPLRNHSRKVLVKFGEEKGNMERARTRYLWRRNPTRSPLDYRVSHTTRQEKFSYLSCNRKEKPQEIA